MNVQETAFVASLSFESRRCARAAHCTRAGKTGLLQVSLTDAIVLPSRTRSTTTIDVDVTWDYIGVRCVRQGELNYLVPGFASQHLLHDALLHFTGASLELSPATPKDNQNKYNERSHVSLCTGRLFQHDWKSCPFFEAIARAFCRNKEKEL